MGLLNRVVEAPHYLTEVNKGSVNMTVWQAHLNERWQQGYRVHTVLEQNGNTVTLFELRE